MHSFRLPVLIGFQGTEMSQKLSSRLKRLNPLGVVFFRRNIQDLKQTRKLIGDLRELLGDLLVAIDHEGGTVNRFPPQAPVPPSAFALGRLNDVKTTQNACAMQADLLAELGFNLNFAPVLDLHYQNAASVIGERAYSEDPSEITAYAKILIQEHHQRKIACCPKHFPGHGRALIDTHFDAGSIDADYSDLSKSDLVPYPEAIKAGADFIMTAHLLYPKLDPNNIAPFSEKIIKGLLKESMGFDGLVISDCVEMSGMKKDHSAEKIIEKGLASGLDLWISSNSLIKEPTFQERLKTAYDLALNNEKNQQRATVLQKKLEELFTNIRSEPEVGSRFDSNEVIELHRKTLLVKKSSPPRKDLRFLLIELETTMREGINLGQKSNPAAQLCAALPQIQGYKRIQAEPSQLESCLFEADKKGLRPLIITKNLYRNQSFESIKKLLKLEEGSVHLALGGIEDLSGKAWIEIASFGYSSWTIQAVVRELEEIIN